MKNTKFDSNRTGTGTREWAEHSLNVVIGCAHNCRYCYARGMALRFGRATREGWATEVLQPAKTAFARRKYPGVVMFPTTHDITPGTLGICRETLCELVAHGNKVLIVSKPHVDCIRAVCSDLEQHKEQVQFRFTIGTGDEATAKFWEPGAPSPAERIEALKHAYSLGFATSVSMEPMLSNADKMVELVNAVVPYVTDTIWIGKLNRPETRVLNESQESAAMLAQIRKDQSDSEILRLVGMLEGNPQIRWKDSVKEVLARS